MHYDLNYTGTKAKINDGFDMMDVEDYNINMVKEEIKLCRKKLNRFTRMKLWLKNLFK